MSKTTTNKGAKRASQQLRRARRKRTHGWEPRGLENALRSVAAKRNKEAM